MMDAEEKDKIVCHTLELLTEYHHTAPDDIGRARTDASALDFIKTVVQKKDIQEGYMVLYEQMKVSY